LREFCHFYQIPFLESNIPKTARNAAKIYFRLKDDGQIINDRFTETKLMQFLESVNADDIDDSFNPFKLKEKWMKFFRGGIQKINLDIDRVLKNNISDDLVDYIADEMNTFNDM